LWTVLETLGWTMTSADRLADVYYYPPGITGEKNRIDYFDSKTQVLRFLRERTKNSDDQPVEWDIVCDALAAYDASLQTTAKKSKNTAKSLAFSSVATSRNGARPRNRPTDHAFLENKQEKRKRSVSSSRPKSSFLQRNLVYNRL
jgi:hypothetical protein